MLRTIPRIFSRSISVGNQIPSAKLKIDSPSNDVDLSSLYPTGSYILLGVPGTFSPGCSKEHIPGYLKMAKEFRDKGMQKLIVCTGNDPFVTAAWKQSFVDDYAEAEEWLEIVSDVSGAFSKELDALWDAESIFGTKRSQRYAAIVNDNKIVFVAVEPDNTGVNESVAEALLDQID